MHNSKVIKQVARQFLQSLEIRPRITKKAVVVALVGLVGSGKSLVANALARLIKATVVEGDAVRVALRKREQGYESAREITEQAIFWVLKRGGNVLVDADFIDSEKRRSLRKLARKAKARVVFLRTVAERDAMIERLIRARYNPNQHLFKSNVIAIREMWRRTPHHYSWSRESGGKWVLKQLPFALLATIDTSDPDSWKREVEKCAKKLLAR